MEIGTLLNSLKKAKRQSDGSFLACCPAHKDDNASLHITQAEGKILLKCFAGCEPESICQSLNIDMSDLFTDAKPERKISAVYSYKDEEGQELYQVVRYEPKGFSQRHKGENGEWVWNLSGVRRVLYHLPEILNEDGIIYLVEGEKDADNLILWGQIATTSAGGAGNWKPEYAESLKGKRVCIIPDKDKAGEAFAQSVYQSLKGVAKELYEIRLPGDNVKDVSDWLNLPDNNIEELFSLAIPLSTEQTEQTEQVEKEGGKLNKVNNTEISVNVSPTEKVDKLWWKLVDEWLEFHKGETFDLDTISRHLGANDRASRQSISKKLSYENEKKNLRKNNRQYTQVDKTFTCIDWVNASDVAQVNLRFPYGIEDNSSFGLEDCVTISPGDIIVLAGVSNMGKTAFCINLVWENMDIYPVTLMGNEYAPAKFKRRVARMTWHNPLTEDGSPKFELIERHSDWASIIRPNNINIIDWVNLPDSFYQIGSIIEEIQQPLRDGIAIVTIQKDSGKELGLGGGFSEHLASLYLTFDYNRMTVRKAKEWHGTNPNGKSFGFTIVNGGTQFHNIRELKKCGKCWGSGKVKNLSCDVCSGSGWVDKEEF